MDFEALRKDWLQTPSEERNCKSHILVQSFSHMCVGIFGQVSMEDKVEMIGIDRDLVHNLLLLVV